jgi:predicted lipid-binding transport protein (Tim44 family)
MRRLSALIALAAALALVLAPRLADARAGYGASYGSRGAYTWSAPPATRTAPYSAQPMQRSLTPSTASPGYGHAGPGYYRSGFGSGFLGGLLGVGLGGLLFGHMFGGAFGFFGFLLRILILVLIIRWLFRLFRGPSPVFAGGPNMFGRGAAPPRGVMPMGSAPPLAIGPADYQAFERTLYDIQAAWSAHSLTALQALATPEMVGYFAEQLADQTSRGVRNTVSDVHLLQGDLSQAWSEGGRDYATVAMRFSMIDVTRDAAGRVIDGSATEHVTATELWTYVRARGGRWILSAIQQAR